MYATIKSHKRVARALGRPPRRAGHRHARRTSRSRRQAIWDHLVAAAPAPQGEDQGRRGRGRRRAAHRRVPARPLAVARGQDRGRRPTGCACSTRSCCGCPSGFTVHPKLVKQLERRREALGADGGIDWAQAEALAFASLLTEGTPIRLTGQDVRARHVLPAPHGPARREDRADATARSSTCRGAGAVRAAQLAAERDRVPRLRVRLQRRGAGDARHVGGAVRRLRQRRAGHHRPVHRLRPGQVGPDLAADAAAAARLRGLGSRALQRRASSASCSSRPRATSASPTSRRRRSTSTCSAARRRSPSSAR